MLTLGHWRCWRCHRVVPTELIDPRHPMACPGCKAELRFIPPRRRPSRVELLLRPYWRDLMRNWSDVCIAAFRSTALLSLLALFVLWFDSSGITRGVAIAALVWFPWCVYRLALARWPEHTARELPARILWVSAFVALYGWFCVWYVSSARHVVTVRYGTTYITEWVSWGGNSGWRELKFIADGIPQRRSGPVAPTGDMHGRWHFDPPGRYVWHWYGEQVSESDWRRRDGIAAGTVPSPLEF